MIFAVLDRLNCAGRLPMAMAVLPPGKTSHLLLAVSLLTLKELGRISHHQVDECGEGRWDQDGTTHIPLVAIIVFYFPLKKRIRDYYYFHFVYLSSAVKVWGCLGAAYRLILCVDP